MKNVKLFSHTDLDGFGCNYLLNILPFTTNCANVGYDKINVVVKEFIVSGEYKNYDKCYITDISVNEEVAELINSTKDLDIRLLDHHPTALWLNKYNWAKVTVEENGEKTSGTELLFYELRDELEESCNEKGFPHHIEDVKNYVTNVKRYDTWLWKTKYNDKIPKMLNDLFLLMGYKRFENSLRNNFFDIDDLLHKNELLLKINEDKINSYIDKKNKEIIPRSMYGHNVGIVFAEQYISELGNELSAMNPQFDLIAIINGSTISYRTVKEDVNCGNFANIFGGGGHTKAAGSQIAFSDKSIFIDTLFNLNR